ncbi:MAG: hypothetical protein AAGU21_00290 [Solidesulfovibrio sp.]|uniref:hypothetical protein n=1 Tax=Solidesulfovibrio sp. TaxID=2910990 RepID=UPI0031595D00
MDIPNAKNYGAHSYRPTGHAGLGSHAASSARQKRAHSTQSHDFPWGGLIGIGTTLLILWITPGWLLASVILVGLLVLAL